MFYIELSVGQPQMYHYAAQEWANDLKLHIFATKHKHLMTANVAIKSNMTLTQIHNII